MIGALTIQGLTPGPMLFQTNKVLVYTIFLGMFIANTLMCICGFAGIRLFTKVLSVPKVILTPCIFVLCVVGSFAMRNNIFDVWVMLISGIIGYFLTKVKVPTSPAILGLILGPMAEKNFRTALLKSSGDPSVFFQHGHLLGVHRPHPHKPLRRPRQGVRCFPAQKARRGKGGEGRMNDVLKSLSLTGIVPVVVLDDAKNAAPLADALMAGGIPCAEITLRTAAGLDSIAAIADKPGVTVGAGSVITLQNCKDAIAAGARFIVSPGLNVKVVEHCLENSVAVLPGCVTPTELMQAMELGLDTVKFFPAGVYGGLA